VLVGRGAGGASTGIYSVFVGQYAGQFTTGGYNTFVGGSAGTSAFSTLTGNRNTFLGFSSGVNTSTGSYNTLIGSEAGENNNTGTRNTSLGSNSGKGIYSGNNNTAIGADADFGTFNLNNATAIGSQARVSQSNSLVLGSIAGIGNGTADTKVGIGTTAPQYALHVVGQNIRVEGNDLPRFSLNFTGAAADGKRWQNYASTNALNFTALNDAENAETFWLQVNRGAGTAISSVIFPNGNLVINNLGAAGSTSLCRNASNQISTCTPGSSAEKGTDALALAALQMQLKQQQIVIDQLRAILCSIKPDTGICKEMSK
jgi:hypothetical protein